MVQSHCVGSSKISRDHDDAQLSYRLLPTVLIGSTLSVRAFEFERMYGLDVSIHRQRNNKPTVWITACFGNQLFWRQKVSTVFQKKTQKFGQGVHHLWRTSSSFFTLWNLHASREANASLETCTLLSKTRATTMICRKKTANILRHQSDCHE